MSSKAEQRALEAYPQSIDYYPKIPLSTVVDYKPKVYDLNVYDRQVFMEGYEQAEKDLGWISVKDRLPEENKWVFVCVDMQGVPQCVGMGYLKNGEWCDDENDNGFCVDYWMEIPQLP